MKELLLLSALLFLIGCTQYLPTSSITENITTYVCPDGSFAETQDDCEPVQPIVVLKYVCGDEKVVDYPENCTVLPQFYFLDEPLCPDESPFFNVTRPTDNRVIKNSDGVVFLEMNSDVFRLDLAGVQGVTKQTYRVGQVKGENIYHIYSYREGRKVYANGVIGNKYKQDEEYEVVLTNDQGVKLEVENLEKINNYNRFTVTLNKTIVGRGLPNVQLVTVSRECTRLD